MTVKELRKRLERLDQNKKVVLRVGRKYAMEYRIEEGYERVWIKGEEE
jgi:hypothetical protein